MNYIIGISGLAGDGKDSVCRILNNWVAKNRSKFNFHRIALADALKEECRDAILDIYGIDVLDCGREDKEKIRDLLVFHGKMKRLETKGTYWTTQASFRMLKKIRGRTDDSVFCIPDIRYSHFENDEIDWIKSGARLANSGPYSSCLIHVKKFTISHSLVDGSVIKTYSSPVNEEEKKNNPKVEQEADFIIEWQDKSPVKPEDDEDCVNSVNYLAERIFGAPETNNSAI